MPGPFDSPMEATGLPQKARMVSTPTPATGLGEGVFFLSDGSGGLTAGEPYFVPENNGTPINVLQGIPGPEDLAFTLVQGNFTGGSDIVLSAGSAIRSENSGLGVPGRPVVLAPGSVVDTEVGALVWGDSYASLTRGKAAVDLQFRRSAATHIVGAGSSYSTIVGGQDNGISVGPYGNADFLGILGGNGNSIGGSFTYGSVIVGGQGNAIYGAVVTNGLGAYKGKVYCSAIVGGQYNTITTAGTTNSGWDNYTCFIGGGANNYIGKNAGSSACFGEGNTIIGDVSFEASAAFCAGRNNMIMADDNCNGAYHSACFGENNTIIAAEDSFAFGKNNQIGDGTNANFASCSFVGGAYNTVFSYGTFMWAKNGYAHYRSDFSAGFGEGVRLYSSTVMAIGAGGTQGEYQSCLYARRISTTNATPTSFISGERIHVPPNRTFGFRMMVTARQTAGSAGTIGDSATWYITGCIKRDGANNTTLVGVPTGTGTPSGFFDAAAATWNVVVTADDTNEALAVTVTGELNKTILWSLSVSDAEVGA